jgi:hypothetical protein
VQIPVNDRGGLGSVKAEVFGPGYTAGVNSEPLAANPHDPGTDEHRRWTRGHIQGAGDLHRASGTYGTRAGQHDYRPLHDPAAEILGDDEDLALRATPALEDPTSILDDPPLRFPGEEPEVEVVTVSGLPIARILRVGISVDLEPFRQAAAIGASMQEAVDNLNRVMASSVADIQDLAASLAVDVERSAAVARRRHGRNAVCPKHGPTVGGTCRICARSHR